MKVICLIQNLAVLVVALFMHTIRAEDKLCTYGKEDSCPKDSYCIKYEQNKDVCWNMFQQPLKTILYPFKPDVSSYCDQGPLSPPGNSHT